MKIKSVALQLKNERVLRRLLPNGSTGGLEIKELSLKLNLYFLNLDFSTFLIKQISNYCSG